MFMDRDDILGLYTVNNLPLPEVANETQPDALDDDIPF